MVDKTLLHLELNAKGDLVAGRAPELAGGVECVAFSPGAGAVSCLFQRSSPLGRARFRALLLFAGLFFLFPGVRRRQPGRGESLSNITVSLRHV